MDQSEVQVGSMRGFHTGDRCKPQSRFMDFPFFLMWMASMVLLFQYPVAVAWTFFSIEVFCFTYNTMLLSVFWDLKMVFAPKGAHTFSSFSLTPLTYGRNIGLAVSSSASFFLDLGAEEKVLLTVLLGYPLAVKTSSRWCNLSCLLVSSQI